MSTFASLQKKYNDFSVPAYQIKVGGTELSKTVFIVNAIFVDLSAGETCNACRFTLGNIYDGGSRKIQPEALDKLKTGAKLAIYLGYGSSVSPVFFGYIHEVRLRFDGEEPELAIYGLDVRALMRENTRGIVYKDKTMSDIVSALLDDYSPLVASKTLNVSALEQETSVAQDADDLSFLLKVATNRGLLLYVMNDKFVIDKPDSTVCIEFDWEQFHMEFGVTYMDASFTGIGCDPAKAERFSVTKPAKPKTAQAKLITTKRQVPLGYYQSGDFASAVAEAWANTAVMDALHGDINCIGVPEVMLGQKIKINNFPLSPLGTGDTFTVVSVSHRLDDEDGFTTTIGIRG